MDLLDTWHALLEGTYFTNVNANPPIKIDGESSFGIYIRKLCLGIEEIPFEALSRLWSALKEFVKKEEMDSSIRDGDDEEMKCCDNEYTDDDDGKYYFHHKGHASGWIYETFEYNEGANNWIREHGFEKFRKTYNL